MPNEQVDLDELRAFVTGAVQHGQRCLDDALRQHSGVAE
jgi:hypothetical protein